MRRRVQGAGHYLGVHKGHFFRWLGILVLFMFVLCGSEAHAEQKRNEPAWQLHNYVVGDSSVGFEWLTVEGPNQHRELSTWHSGWLDSTRDSTTQDWWWVTGPLDLRGQLSNGKSISCRVWIDPWPFTGPDVSHEVSSDGSCSGWAH